MYNAYTLRAHELLLKIVAVLAKVSMLREQLLSVLVDLSLYYCCTAHQALAVLRSLCTEGCARTIRSTCMGVCNMLYVNLYGPQLLYSVRKFGHFFLTFTVPCGPQYIRSIKYEMLQLIPYTII